MEKFFTTGKVAKILKVTKQAIGKWIREGKLIPAKITETGRYLFSDEQIKQFQNGNGNGNENGNGNGNKFFDSNFLDDLKNQTAAIADRLLTHSKDGKFICPFCGNGSGKDATGVDINQPGNHCFVCGNSFNIFQAVQQQHNCNFNEAVKLCADAVNLNLQYDSLKTHSKNHLHNISPAEKLLTLTDDKEYYHRDLTPYYDACNKALFDYQKAVNYLKSRNLFDELLIDIFKIGYDPTINCIVIPHNKFYCTRRQITDNKKFRFIHNLKNAQTALFNADCVNDSEVIFITESATDALSIIKVGGSAIAIAGAGQKANRIRLYHSMNKLENKPALIILFDNDKSGKIQSDEMLKEIKLLGFFGIKKNLPAEFNDSNEMLQRDETALKNFVADSIAEVKNKLKEWNPKEEIKKDSADDTKKPPRKPLSTCEAVPSCPIDLILPRDFRYTEMGISYRKISDGGKFDYKLAFGTPIAITRCFVNIDEDETEKLEIAFMINNKWKYKIVNSVTLYDAKKIVSLRDFGLDVSSSSAKYAVDFIQYLVKDNRDKIPIITAYNQLGWHDDLFVSPFENTDYIVDNQQNNFVNSLKCKGDFEKWKQSYLEILKYPLARFAVACSLAVPLLNITHCRNFTFYTWGTSRAGKTIAALFAASVWGNHKEIVRNFNLTTNAAEGILTENNDFPTFFDEKQLASKHFDFAKTLMTIGNGVNKGRMKDNTKMRVIKHFRTIAITTGEEEIFNSSDTQGIFTRTISAHCDDKILPDALARRLYMMIDDHFGYAGKFFLDNLLNDDFDRIKEFYNYIIDQLSLYDEDKHLPDHIRYIALACLTEALFFKYLFNLSFDSFDKLLTFNFNNSFISAFMNSNLFIDNYLQTQDDISDVKRAWDWTLGWISANRDHFEIEPNDLVRPPYFGKVSIIEDQKYLFVNNQIFKSELEKSGGFNYSKLIYEFVKKGLIATSSKVEKGYKNPRPTVIHRINQILTRCLKISFDLINSEEKNR